jgi:alanyl-tRNA synthetase
LATSGDLDLAISGDFYMATDTGWADFRRVRSVDVGVPLRGVPHAVLRIEVSVPCCSGQHCHRYGQLEQLMIVVRRWNTDGTSLLDELLTEAKAAGWVGDVFGASAEVEGILVRFERDTVQGVATITVQVTLLRRRHDESEEALVADQRTHRVNAGPSVSSDSCQEPQPDAYLVEERTSLLGHRRHGLAELDPTPHDADRAKLHLPRQHGSRGVVPAFFCDPLR